MREKTKGILMMVPFLIFCLFAAIAIVRENMNTTLASIIVYLGLMVIVGSIALGAFILAIGGYEKYHQKET